MVIYLTAAALLLTCVAAKTAARLRQKQRRRRRLEQRQAREVSRERAREQHYMRNFWSYDGSLQEEFEG